MHIVSEHSGCCSQTHGLSEIKPVLRMALLSCEREPSGEVSCAGCCHRASLCVPATLLVFPPPSSHRLQVENLTVDLVMDELGMCLSDDQIISFQAMAEKALSAPIPARYGPLHSKHIITGAVPGTPAGLPRAIIVGCNISSLPFYGPFQIVRS